MANKELTPLQYFKRLKNLIGKAPKGCKVVYDYMTTSIYVIDDSAKFIDNEKNGTSAIIGSTTPQNGMGYGGNTGYEKDKIIGSIEVELSAVQQH